MEQALPVCYANEELGMRSEELWINENNNLLNP